MQTVLATRTARISGKKVTVETIKGERSRQDIYYRVNGMDMDYNGFWKTNPVFFNGARKN